MKFGWFYVTGDTIISKSPSHIGTIIVTPDGAQATADITVYDGESADDPQAITIRTGTGQTKVIHFQPYLETQRGVYVDVGDNVEEVLIQLCWEHE